MGARFLASNRVRRGLLVSGVALGLLVVVAIAGTLMLGSHRAPAPLSLGSPSAGAGSLAGSWKVGAGSEAGYRVREQFINQPAPTEAVARTTEISGGLKVTGSGSTLRATGLHFKANLAALVSQDKYANYQIYQRDFFIRSIYLQTDTYPSAEFVADSIDVPSAIGSGPVSVTVTGKLTVHGETKSVTTQLQAQQTASGVEVAGSINVDMRDFNVSVPSISFTTAEPQVVIEYHLILVRA